MANKFKIKRSSVAGRVPAANDLETGELAVNLTDGRLFTKNGSNTVVDVVGQNVNTSANVVFNKATLESLSVNGAFTANGTNGNAGQVLTSNGDGVYWATVSTGGSGGDTVTGFSYTPANNTLTIATTAGSFTANIQAGLNQAFSNAISNAANYTDTKAGEAYSNAIAYAASNTYVNDTFAPKLNPTFTGTVILPTVSANGSIGTAGQVLTSNGSGVYWSTVSGGGGGFTNGQSISVSNVVVTDTASLAKISANGSLGTLGQVLTTDGGNVYWSDPATGGTTSLKILPINVNYNNDFGDLSASSSDAFGINTMYAFDCATSGFLQTVDLNRTVVYSDDQLNIGF